MTENIAPSSSAPNGEAMRGIPYYEKLKRDLRDTLTKKRQLDKNMVNSFFFFNSGPPSIDPLTLPTPLYSSAPATNPLPPPKKREGLILG